MPKPSGQGPQGGELYVKKRAGHVLGDVVGTVTCRAPKE